MSNSEGSRPAYTSQTNSSTLASRVMSKSAMCACATSAGYRRAFWRKMLSTGNVIQKTIRLSAIFSSITVPSAHNSTIRSSSLTAAGIISAGSALVTWRRKQRWIRISWSDAHTVVHLASGLSMWTWASPWLSTTIRIRSVWDKRLSILNHQRRK